jgi:Tfp pilus assembly protein PilP
MKKKINIILIIAVAAVWGTVIYKYVNQYLAKQDLTATTHYASRSGEVKIWNKDTFNLQPLKRDPFLNISSQRAIPAVKRIFVSPAVKKPKKTISAAPFPQLKYLGYIKSNKAELVHLKVNDKLQKFRIGESVDGLMVLKIFKDSVKVSFNGEVRGIVKS